MARMAAFASPFSARLRSADFGVKMAAAGAFRLPAAGFIARERDVRLVSRVAFVVERQRRTRRAFAAITGQRHWPAVFVKRLETGGAGRLPVARLNDRFLRIIAGFRCGTDAARNGFPDWAVGRAMAGNGMGNLVQQRIDHGIVGAVARVVFCNFDPFAGIFANAQSRLGVGQAERPIR